MLILSLEVRILYHPIALVEKCYVYFIVKNRAFMYIYLSSFTYNFSQT
jgi:hypothetical protein